MTGIMRQRGSLVLRGIGAGTLLGLLGPVVLVLVLIIRWDFRVGLRDCVAFLGFLLVCAVPAFACALVGGLAAASSHKASDWPAFFPRRDHFHCLGRLLSLGPGAQWGVRRTTADFHAPCGQFLGIRLERHPGCPHRLAGGCLFDSTITND